MRVVMLEEKMIALAGILIASGLFLLEKHTKMVVNTTI